MASPGESDAAPTWCQQAAEVARHRRLAEEGSMAIGDGSGDLRGENPLRRITSHGPDRSGRIGRPVAPRAVSRGTLRSGVRIG